MILYICLNIVTFVSFLKLQSIFLLHFNFLNNVLDVVQIIFLDISLWWNFFGDFRFLVRTKI